MNTSNFSLGFLNMSLWITVEVALVIQFFLENHFFGDLTINSKHSFFWGGGGEWRLGGGCWNSISLIYLQQQTQILIQEIIIINFFKKKITSAPNHSCPARFSWRTSSGNLTRKSRLAFWFPMASSMIFCTTPSTLSWHALSLLTRAVHRSGSFLPSKLSSSAATSLSSSSAKKNWANIELSVFCNVKKIYSREWY